MRYFVIVVGILFLTAPALAGPNPEASLAMHTIASYDYLYCDDFFPIFGFQGCAGIDNSAEPEELAASSGYVYIVFLAYNTNAISGVEYCIGGWPADRAAFPPPTLWYCPETSLVYGDPFYPGGALQIFGTTVETPCSQGRVAFFAWEVWGSSPYPAYLPIRLDFYPSRYSYPDAPHSYVIGPGPDFLEDEVVSQYGCTIGGTDSTPVPYPDCDTSLPTAVESVSWTAVKSMYR